MSIMSKTSDLQEVSEPGVSGICRDDLRPVAEAFAENFKSRGELGASLCIHLDGEPVLDLWGGQTSPDGGAWQKDTTHVIFSCTKPATALCLHLLAARGKVDLDAPVTTYWPEYAQNGKESTTLRMLLDHSAGQPALRTPLKPDCLTDWSYMIENLQQEEPFWTPGTQVSYHAVTFGFLVGEVVRRVSGKSLGQFFHDEIATPLGLDFAIGLPEEDEGRVAPVIPHRPSKDAQDTPFLKAAKTRDTVPNLFVFNSGDWAIKGVNSREGRAAEIPAANGVTNARGLSKLFSALATGGAVLGLDPDYIASFSQASAATHRDATFIAPSRFGPGFMLNMGRRPTPEGPESLIMGQNAFGHVGMGGSLGFADPECRLGFGYSMNKLGGGLLLNTRGQSLVDATYRCLGYRNDTYGYWAR
ncbi:serine hydrolase domain-containing protein [Heliomarina baculiformis]|uniref:serine hydrolase domain-containing protein n=1 Tax=Heliomarina baculiformis TaxID=2872036 RepID=UPI001EE38DE4|nr:serine hydrolase domain-containing protein [Heliomarina baculiformis]